jgi:hypothetical protein
MGIKHSFNTAIDNQSTIKSSDWNENHIISDTNLIPNLNADLFDGNHASALTIPKPSMLYQCFGNWYSDYSSATAINTISLIQHPQELTQKNNTLVILAQGFTGDGEIHIRTDINGTPKNTMIIPWSSGTFSRGTIDISYLPYATYNTIVFYSWVPSLDMGGNAIVGFIVMSK